MIKKSFIHRTDGQLYMIRWSLFSFIKVHKFVRSDDSCHHDHPWWFFSIVLRGHYYDVTQIEKYPNVKNAHAWKYYETKREKKTAGCMMFRKALHTHRVELQERFYYTGYPDEPKYSYSPPVFKPCWTLVINGPEVREWGFMTKTGWTEWKKFFARDKAQNICD